MLPASGESECATPAWTLAPTNATESVNSTTLVSGRCDGIVGMIRECHGFVHLDVTGTADGGGSACPPGGTGRYQGFFTGRDET